MTDQLFEKALAQRILPAVTLRSKEDALPVADAFLEAGVNCMEITFRTEAAASAIQRIREKRPEIFIGAGTLLSKADVQQAIDAGAQFGLAPGYNPVVAEQALKGGLPFIPGVFTPSEIELAMMAGFSVLKIFPVEQAGGPAYLQSLQGPYGTKRLRFIPMGGVTLSNMRNYLTLPNVLAVGGSWIAAREMMESKNYGAISAAARAALQQVPE